MAITLADGITVPGLTSKAMRNFITPLSLPFGELRILSRWATGLSTRWATGLSTCYRRHSIDTTRFRREINIEPVQVRRLVMTSKFNGGRDTPVQDLRWQN